MGRQGCQFLPHQRTLGTAESAYISERFGFGIKKDVLFDDKPFGKEPIYLGSPAF